LILSVLAVVNRLPHQTADNKETRPAAPGLFELFGAFALALMVMVTMVVAMSGRLGRNYRTSQDDERDCSKNYVTDLHKAPELVIRPKSWTGLTRSDYLVSSPKNIIVFHNPANVPSLIPQSVSLALNPPERFRPQSSQEKLRSCLSLETPPRQSSSETSTSATGKPPNRPLAIPALMVHVGVGTNCPLPKSHRRRSPRRSQLPQHLPPSLGQPPERPPIHTTSPTEPKPKPSTFSMLPSSMFTAAKSRHCPRYRRRC
jgi:hypothetical protein